MKRNKLFSIIFMLIANLASAVEIVKINPSLQSDGSTQFEVVFQGRMVAPPHFVPFQNSVAIKWPDAKNAVSQNPSGVELKGTQDSLFIVFNKNIINPSDLSKLSLKLTGNTVKTVIPNSIFKQKNISPVENKKPELESLIHENTEKKIQAVEKKSPEIVKSNPIKETKTNEDYLSYLLSSVDKESAKNQIKEIPALDSANVKMEKQPEKKLAPAKIINVDKGFESKEARNFSSYMVKIFIVLALIVGFILLLAKVSKKMMIGKNKLGFLNNSKVVEILNTTYIAPKRQLILVKAHDQVMLLSNSENGISFISEIKDLSNILKNTETEVSGSNFDTDFNNSTTPATEIVLKDSARIFESKPLESKTSKMRSVLKNKAKSLKAWQ
jgi:flagellar biogenesis protein FliO